MDPAQLINAYRLGKKPIGTTDKRNLLVTVKDKSSKDSIMSASKAMRPDGIYVRESLTQTRTSIMYVLRKAKREFPQLVSGCSSFNGSVFVYLKPSNPQASGAKDSRMCINSFRKLDKFCADVIDRTVDSFVDGWNN